MIKFKGVVKKFGSRTILKNLSFEVGRGEIRFILGTSGTGKSVLLKSLVGLLRVDAGEVWIDGQEVSKLSEIEYLPVRKKCGMVFQHPALFDSITVYENIAFGLRKHFKMPEDQIRERVSETLSSVYLPAIGNKLPGQISYGMQKRVSLARTLALKPNILLFDEPTTGLDPVTTSAINALIEELSRKYQTTSIVVSHDMACALSIADKIMVIDQGEIIDEGTRVQMQKSTVPLVREFLAEVIS